MGIDLGLWVEWMRILEVDDHRELDRNFEEWLEKVQDRLMRERGGGKEELATSRLRPKSEVSSQSFFPSLSDPQKHRRQRGRRGGI